MMNCETIRDVHVYCMSHRSTGWSSILSESVMSARWHAGSHLTHKNHGNNSGEIRNKRTLQSIIPPHRSRTEIPSSAENHRAALISIRTCARFKSERACEQRSPGRSFVGRSQVLINTAVNYIRQCAVITIDKFPLRNLQIYTTCVHFNSVPF